MQIAPGAGIEVKEMRLLVVIVFCLALFLPRHGLAGDVPKKDADMLQGQWQAKALQFAGKAASANQVKGFTLNVQGDRLTISMANAGPTKMTYKINPAVSPKTIDLTLTAGGAKGQVVLGIYAFAEDGLKLCVREAPGLGGRPKNFNTNNENGVFFVTLKRIKEGEKRR